MAIRLLAPKRTVAGTMAVIRTVVPGIPQGNVHGTSWSHSVAWRLAQRSASGLAEETSCPTRAQGLQLSDSCVKQLNHITAGGSDAMMRVTVEGGGCSGFQYKFTLDSTLNPDDKVFERDCAKVVIDELSLSLLDGSTVDFHQELIRSSFRIMDNPNAELGCSCGVSFAVKDL